jgi:hypothetical protein
MLALPTPTHDREMRRLALPTHEHVSITSSGYYDGFDEPLSTAINWLKWQNQPTTYFGMSWLAERVHKCGLPLISLNFSIDVHNSYLFKLSQSYSKSYMKLNFFLPSV